MKRIPAISGSVLSPLMATAANIVLLYVIYAICRIEFVFVNYDYFEETVTSGRIFRIFWGGLAMDTPAIFYCNALYILMMLLPYHKKERQSYYTACHWYYYIFNGIAVIANLADSFYFRFTMHRSTADVFTEFANESNLGQIFLAVIINYWPVLILVWFLFWMMWNLYVDPNIDMRKQKLPRYYLLTSLSLIVAAITTVAGIRGGLLNRWWLYVGAFPLLYIAWRLYRRNWADGGARRWVFLFPAVVGVAMIAVAPIGGWRHRDIRPIALSNAYTYTSKPIETALVLNTPFSVIRSIGKTVFSDPGYYADKKTLDKIYNPVHPAAGRDSLSMKRKNVVVIIVESFGADYIGALNRNKPGFVSRTPFVDSLINHSAVWQYTFSNGRKSIDAMPSILASIPMFEKPFILTPRALNRVEGLPAHLGSQGYETAFFHGARTGSMGFDAFAQSIGFKKYFGREDFDKDSRFGAEKDFDGYWGIWDEPFMQYFALTLSDFNQPFFASIFTASSHHPFNVPDKYKDRFPEEEIPIQKCIRYTDNALRLFFDTAKKQPWFDNTIFVLTADHSNESANPEYRTDIGGFSIPIIIYDPSGGIPTGMRPGIAQQIDIMPTILNYLGYPAPYVAFGKDLLGRDAAGLMQSNNPWAVNYLNGIYQFVENGYVLQFDGKEATGLFRLDDGLMSHNLVDDPATEKIKQRMISQLKAVIQSYMDRMTSNRLTLKKED